MFPMEFRCALMMLADDTVSNISASSAETRVHTERNRSFHMLIWDTKAKRKIHPRREIKSSFMAILANLPL